jgi:HPt (histidine-containing phosphotransfer) domain-containing protein
MARVTPSHCSRSRVPADAVTEHNMHASAHALTRKRSARTSRRGSATWDADALAAVWESQRYVVDGRLTVIEQAKQALAEDRLDADLRERAQRAAHMLAGSLGMFGFGDASEAAGSLESALSLRTTGAGELAGLLAEVRGEIELPRSPQAP